MKIKVIIVTHLKIRWNKDGLQNFLFSICRSDTNIVWEYSDNFVQCVHINYRKHDKECQNILGVVINVNMNSNHRENFRYCFAFDMENVKYLNKVLNRVSRR